MKLLAFTDTHGDHTCSRVIAAKIKHHKPDLFVCCGDFTIFEHKIIAFLKTMAGYRVPGYLIHGNHERKDVVLEALHTIKSSLCFIHGRIVENDGLAFVGWGGGGFAREDPGLRAFMESHKKSLKAHDAIVLVTHAPPLGTALDELGDYHVGCKTIRDFVRIFPKTTLVLSGHIHEQFLAEERIGRTLLCNPGPLGTLFETTHLGVSIIKE